MTTADLSDDPVGAVRRRRRLSTTCFSLGLSRGMELVESMDGVYACFIDEDYQIHYSDGMEKFLRKD